MKSIRNQRSTFDAQRTRALGLVGLAILVALPGCAAITNPVANGVPVRLLPPELFAESREDFVRLPLALLRQPPPKHFLLQPGDTLGVYIEGLLGDAETPPPVNIPDSADLPPSIGYPLPIREDGTVSLPLIGPVEVAGLRVEDAEQEIVNEYSEQGITAEENPRRIFVTLMRPRYTRVLVVRQDSQRRQLQIQTESLVGLGTSRQSIGGSGEGFGQVVELPAYENDVLNALVRTGGEPGLESTQEVIIERGYWDDSSDPTGAARDFPTEADLYDQTKRTTIRIPLRLRPGEVPPFKSEDIILQSGDIVTVRLREPEFYYTGGLIPSNEYPLPNDYDLTVLEAIMKSRGPLLNGGVNTSNLNGALISPGLGSPSPSLLAVLRKTPNGGQVTIRVDLNEAARDPRENILVQAEDVLVLQESPDEAFARYCSQVFQLDFFFRWLNRSDAVGNGTLSVP